MHIFLIRHGESISNVGENYVKRIPDHLVTLTEKGIEQANENGKWLAEYCKANNVDLSKARIWRSPYMRTRQTCDEFNKYLPIWEHRMTLAPLSTRYLMVGRAATIRLSEVILPPLVGTLKSQRHSTRLPATSISTMDFLL